MYEVPKTQLLHLRLTVVLEGKKPILKLFIILKTIFKTCLKQRLESRLFKS